MELARLVYECVRDCNHIPENAGFTYDSFLDGQYDDDPNWSTVIANVWSALNLALSRLFDAGKIPLRESDPLLVDIGGLVKLPEDCGEVVSVWRRDLSLPYGYRTISFRGFGSDTLSLDVDERDVGKVSVIVEYRPEIPHFSQDSIQRVMPISDDPNSPDFDSNSDQGSHLDDEGDYVDPNVGTDLKKLYGISDRACDYVKLFVRSELTRSMDPYLAAQDRQIAEQCFQALRDFPPEHIQSSIERRL